MSDFEKLKEELLSKGNFYSSLTGKHVLPSQGTCIEAKVATFA